MVLNVNIKLFFVENYMIQVELWNICLKNLYTYLKGTNHCQVAYIDNIYVHFIPTERTPPKTDSLVF